MQEKCNNINLLRFIAASAVVYDHMGVLLGQNEGHVIMGGSLGGIAVNAFFLLSGYLIACSWKHSNSFASYLIRRSTRIFPALIVVVLVTVFVIGPLFTSLTPSEYFSSAETWKYLESILFSSTWSLPGVFGQLPYPSAVNGSLWTLRYEFAMYLLVPVAYVLLDRVGEARRPVAFGLAAALITGYFLTSGLGLAVPEVCVHGLGLASYFFIGCVVYEFDLAKHFDPQYSVLAVLFMLVFACEDGPICILLMLAATTVFVFGFAFAPRPRFANCFSRNDFSYGIYVWAFPIQQILIQLGGGTAQDSALLYSLAAFAITLPLAAASWFLVEKPCIAWGKQLSRRF